MLDDAKGGLIAQRDLFQATGTFIFLFKNKIHKFFVINNINVTLIVSDCTRKVAIESDSYLFLRDKKLCVYLFLIEFL